MYQWATNHGYQFDNPGMGKALNHPVQTISWFDAVKWCNARSEKEGRAPAYYTNSSQTTVYRTGQVNVQSEWVKWTVGYRLPTEAEWEKAAQGGSSTIRRFSWSDVDTITHDQANYCSDTSYPYDISTTRGYHPVYGTNAPPTPYTCPAGTFPANGYGLQEMTGNVFEWCWDWHGTYSSASQTDPRGPVSGLYRVARGGCWDSRSYYCRVAYRNGTFTPASKTHQTGIRTVMSWIQP